MRDLSSPKSSNVLMVDIPWIGPATGNEKFIFSRNKNPSILFNLKKLIRGYRMQQVAKDRLQKLCEAKQTNTKVNALFKNIKNKPEAVPIEISEVVTAFSKMNLAEAFNTTDLLADMPQELISEVQRYEAEQFASPVTIDELISATEKYLSHSKLAPEILGKLFSNLTLLRNYHTDAASTLKIYPTELYEQLSGLNLVLEQDKTLTPYLKKIALEINKLNQEVKTQYEEFIKAQASETELKTQNLPKWLTNSRKISQQDYRYIEEGLKINMPVFNRSEINQQAFKAFFDFIENPNKYVSNKETRRHLLDFLNLFYEDIEKITPPKLKALCLNQIDRLEGVLQQYEKSDLHAYPEKDLNKHSLATLKALRNQIETNGPSSSMYHLFQYVLHREHAITPQSFWHLSSLSKAHKENIKDSLPPETLEKFTLAMKNLRKDLKEFKQRSITNRHNLMPLATEARRKIIGHISLKLNNLAIFNDNEKNNSALEVFLALLNNKETDLLSLSVQQSLEAFFSLFFDNIKQLDTDTRILCLKEIDRIKGLLLNAQNADIKNYDLTKVQKNSIFDFATALQLNAEQLEPSGFIMDLLHYLERGSESITRLNYQALNHVAAFTHSDIALVLEWPQKTYFSEAIRQLRMDLNAFKAAQIPSTPS